MFKSIINIKEWAPKYIQFKTPLVTDLGFDIVGYFPYHTASVRTTPVPRDLLKHIEELLCDNKYPTDNKVVYVCKDKVNFGTSSFALFFHDMRVQIGSIEQIQDY
jgi:hypothetical protein